jgi:hypothetical protein
MHGKIIAKRIKIIVYVNMLTASSGNVRAAKAVVLSWIVLTTNNRTPIKTLKTKRTVAVTFFFVNKTEYILLNAMIIINKVEKV